MARPALGHAVGSFRLVRLKGIVELMLIKVGHAGEVRVPDVGTIPESVVEDAEIRGFQVASAEISVAEVSAFKVALIEIGAVKLRVCQAGMPEICA
jgi:hypothetical protein